MRPRGTLCMGPVNMDCQIHAWYDAAVDLLMVELPHGDTPPADSEKLAPDVFLELEREGAPLVLEVLRASEHYPSEWLSTIPNAPAERPVARRRGPHSARVMRALAASRPGGVQAADSPAYHEHFVPAGDAGHAGVG